MVGTRARVTIASPTPGTPVSRSALSIVVSVHQRSSERGRPRCKPSRAPALEISTTFTLFADGIGMADPAAHRPATADTLFRIGSVSKGFASLSILKLQEQGKLSLNDPLSKYAPEIWRQNPWEATDPNRIVYLLEYTTGWDDTHPAEYRNSDPKPLTLDEGLALHPDSRVSRWRPGTRMAYCNSGPR